MKTYSAASRVAIVTAKNGWGDEMPTTMKYENTVDAEDGDSLVLTIDATIQSYAEKYLEVAVKENGCTNRGAAIVMDVDTGAILAMATKGDFDPNQPFEIADPTIAAAIAELSGDEQSAKLLEERQKQWVNKPIADYYEPGSVFKVFTASMAREEGLVDESSTFDCTGGFIPQGGSLMKSRVSSNTASDAVRSDFAFLQSRIYDHRHPRWSAPVFQVLHRIRLYRKDRDRHAQRIPDHFGALSPGKRRQWSRPG